jgi:hypothetical protein
MVNITFLELKPSYPEDKFMVQVFVHSVMQMVVMDKVLSGFINTFYENSNFDDNKKLNEAQGKTVLKGLKEFIDNLEVVLYEALLEDCCEIMRKYQSDNSGAMKKKSGNTSNEVSNGDSKTIIDSPISSNNGNGSNMDISPSRGKEVPSDRRSSESSITLSTEIEENESGSSGSNLDGLVAVDNSNGYVDDILVDVNVAESSTRNSFEETQEEERSLGSGKLNFCKVGGEIDEMDRSIDKEVDIDVAVALRHRIEQERGREKERREVLRQCNEDEMRSQVRSAVRRHVEVEVFVPCSSRLRLVLDRSFSVNEGALRRNILKITHQPQSFFGIPVNQISPSSWDEVVFLLRDIRSKTLPHDRLEALLLTAKEIPLQFIREHPSTEDNTVTLGADDFLPIFIYILARAQIPNLLALNEELQALCDPDKRMSETGYYLATLEASLQHIAEADVNTESDLLFPMMRMESRYDSDEDDISSQGDSKEEKDESVAKLTIEK